MTSIKSQTELIPRFLEISPEFRPSWEEHLKYWGDEPAGIYNDIAEFCRHVVDCYGAGKTHWFPEFFQFVEDLIQSDKEELRGIAAVGILETMQVQASHRDHGENVFLQWLGPHSLEAWSEIEAQWRKHGNLADIIRFENQDKE